MNFASARRQLGSTAARTIFGLMAACVIAAPARAGWLPTAGTNDYLNVANWSDGNINGDFPATTYTGLQVATFGSDYAAAGGLNIAYVGNYSLTLRSPGTANRTLTLNGDVTVAPASNVTVTIGSTTANQGLNVNLGGGTRTLTVATGKTLSFVNTVSNGNIVRAGGGTLAFTGAVPGSFTSLAGAGSLTLLSQASTFVGDLVASGASTVLTIGDQNAISDGCFGNVSNNVSLLNGATLKLGATADKAHVLLNPLRTLTISGGAKTTAAYGVARVHIPGNIVGTGGITDSNEFFLFSGTNTFSGGFALNGGGLAVSSDRNLGTGSLSFPGYGTTFSVLGTELTSFGSRTVTFSIGNNGGFTLDIQNPANAFTINQTMAIGSLNSGSATALSKAGQGELVITAPQTYYNGGTAPSTGLRGGTLTVDYAAGGTLNGTTHRIAFNGGTLNLLGKGGFLSTTQALSYVKLNAGGGVLAVDNRNGSGTTRLNLGDFTTTAPDAGGSLRIRPLNVGSGAVTITSTQTNDASGIIGGGRVVYNDNDWASIVGGTTVGAYGGYTVGLPASGSSLLNYSHTGDATVSTSESVNTLKLATSAGSQALTIGAGQFLTLAGGGLLFAGANDYAVTGGYLASTLAVGANSDLVIHSYGAGKLTIDSVITNGLGASTLTIAGPGSVILTSTNRYTGQTFVNNGATLSISSNNQLNNGATTQLNIYGGTLQVTETLATSRTVILGGVGTFDVANGKTLTLSGAVNSGPAAGGGLTLANSDGGNGALVLSGDNSGNSGMLYGGVAINAGILRLGHNNALNRYGFNTLSFGPAAGTKTLQINGARTITVAGLTSAATDAIVENGAAGAALLNVYNGADNVFAGTLQNGATGALAVAKAGCGTLTLTGASTYTNATTILGGTLRVNGSLAAGSAVTVVKGALGGTGTVAGPVTVAAGATLAPGAGGIATLATGPLTLNNASVLDFEFGGGTGDRVDVTGALTVDGILNVTTLSGFGGGTYTILSCTGALTNNGLNLGTTPNDGLTYSIRATSNSVLLTAAHPATILMIR